jgi:D-alanyl-D-alanine carboxypeptidase
MKRVAIISLLCLLVAPTLLAGLLREHPELAPKIALLEQWIESQRVYRGIPGLAIAVVHDQELVWSRGFGVADAVTKAPVTGGTIFRIASITKTFTATAIMQLRDRGKLRLDDPVVNYLPWFTYKNRHPDGPVITIRHLLTHTSGLPREAAFPYWTDHNFPTREEMIKAFHDQESVFEPETRYKYSNLAMAILGEVIAAASGMSYEAFVTRNLLQPLGMTGTSVNPREDLRDRWATGYGRRFDDGSRKPVQMIDARGLVSAANISSTVEDLGRWASFHMLEGRNTPGQIMKGSTLREMHRVQWVNSSWTGGSGIGFSVSKGDGRQTFGHGGWVEGNRSQLTVSPKEKVGVIVMVNADDGEPGFFAARAMAMLAPAIAKLTAPVEAPAKFDPAWQRYTGTYTDPSGWETKVLIMDNKLMMYGLSYPPEDDPMGALSELMFERDGVFRAGGDGGSGELVYFELGPDGKVVRIKSEENYLYPKK